jgi:hypothetical protein
MKVNCDVFGSVGLGSGLAVAVAFAMWLPGAAPAAQHAMGTDDMLQMQQIKTQAQAEALKPGDSMSMTCSKCKHVMVRKVTTDNEHVKMMTVGDKSTCQACGGSVEVVATGTGKGKDAEVKHVCSKCGDDAMFCSATKPGAGSMKDMKGMGKEKK